jgi:uncharacterized protein (DUF2164 family)
MTRPIELSREARQAASAGLRQVLADELDVEIGALQADLILDRVILDLGPILYNRAITDARAVIAARAEDMDEALYGQQRQTDLR